MSRMIAALAAALLAFPAAASAAAEPTKNGKAEMVCKTKAKTGTRFPSKTCYTREQWDAMSEQNKRDAKDLIERPIIETRRS